MFRVLAAILAAAVMLRAQDAPPRILLDQPLRAVEYQLERLSSDEIVRVERHDDDPKYRPVYMALLTRQGLAKAIRDEALAAVVKLDGGSAPVVILGAMAKVRPEDDVLGDQLVALLLAQPADALKSQRAFLTKTIDESSSALVRRGAYGALIMADGRPDEAYSLALRHAGHVADIVPALADARPDDVVFRRLVAIASGEAGPAARDAAILALARMPERTWVPTHIPMLINAMLGLAESAPAAVRTDPPVIDAMQLAERLIGALPEADRAAQKRRLRALGVRVIRLVTIPEQMSFDVKWFTVEAGKAVEILLTNRDAMPHNLIVGAPKAVEPIGTAAMSMGMPSDPAVKAFVPESPLVLQATALLKEGETARLSFTAPPTPGEYVFLCSYPGHWVRMYGVMLVVDNLEAWEAKPTVPTDPITNKPFDR